jgi:hypothetical protein
MQPGERAGMPLDRVGDDWQAIAREARRIVIGDDDDAVHLRAQARDDVADHGFAGKLDEALLAAHAQRAAPRQ